MRMHILGYERVFHESPDYGRIPSRVPDPPKGSRCNPSGAKVGGPNTTSIAGTSRWLAPKKK